MLSLILGFEKSSAFELHHLPNQFERTSALTDPKTRKEFEETVKIFYETDDSKRDQAIIETIVEMAKSRSLADFKNALGEPVPVGKEYTLPASYQYGCLSVGGGHQHAGESSGHFFQIGESGGIYVIAYEKWKKLAAAAVYVKGKAEPMVVTMTPVDPIRLDECDPKEYFQTKTARQAKEHLIIKKMMARMKELFVE